MVTFAQLVDRHGPTRASAMQAFRHLPRYRDMPFAELMAETWPVWQQIVADLLDATDCPNCDGTSQLGPTNIDCPTCDGVGYTFGRQIVDVTRPKFDSRLPPPSTGVERPKRPDPLPFDPAATGLTDVVIGNGRGG